MKEKFAGHFDPEIFNKFQNIAECLYTEYAGREDERLKEQFEEITTKYFHCDCCS
ncbi:hypothetical protein [Desulfopila sp. IMCC35008]|uniref:hypothetical protein n=1 Tax=Desulfopila sp. IMCC35008 TaxID=2653858 RepID=UPI0013D18C26|nr:hypothetical protein [Desulfopila sp. IMCC35008]